MMNSFDLDSFTFVVKASRLIRTASIALFKNRTRLILFSIFKLYNNSAPNIFATLENHIQNWRISLNKTPITTLSSLQAPPDSEVFFFVLHQFGANKIYEISRFTQTREFIQTSSFARMKRIVFLENFCLQTERRRFVHSKRDENNRRMTWKGKTVTKGISPPFPPHTRPKTKHADATIIRDFAGRPRCSFSKRRALHLDVKMNF